MFKAFVYRLYPSKSQRRRLEAVRETCRHFYNDCRRQRKEAYEERGETISKTVQLRKVKVEKATSPFALDIHSHILQNVVADLDKAFEAFFRRVKAGENPGYPRFKVRNRFAGFGFKEYGNGFKVGTAGVASNSPASAGSPSAGTARSQGRSRRPAYSAGLANGSSPSPARSRSPSRCRRPGNRSASTWGS